MKRARQTLILIALTALALSSVAMAAGSRKLTQHGAVDGDAGASVRLAVIKHGGAPTSVKGVKIKNLTAGCDGGPEQIELNLFGAAEVDPDRRTFERTYGSPDAGTVDLEGKVSRNGDRVKGSISGKEVDVPGVGTCEVPSIEFVTKR